MGGLFFCMHVCGMPAVALEARKGYQLLWNSSAYMCVHHVGTVPTDVKRGYQIP